METCSCTFWNSSAVAICIIIAIFIIFVLIAIGFYKIRNLQKHVLMIYTRTIGKDIAISNDSLNNYADSGMHNCGSYDEGMYEIPRDEFVRETSTVIGMGQYSHVYKCFMSRFNKFVAVKLNNSEETTCLRSMLNEIKMLAYLGEHNNILKLLGAYTKEIRFGFVFFVTEYLENGVLLTHLKELKETDGQDSNELLRKLYGFCEDISMGMQYLAEKKVVLCDLAARNILLDANNVCKISEFGLAQFLGDECYYLLKTPAMVPWPWVSLETLETWKFYLKSDVWSMGVTFWEIFTLGQQPYEGLTWDGEFCGKLQNGFRLPKPEFGSDEIYNEILKCWSVEVDARPCPGHFGEFFRGQKNDPIYVNINTL